MILGTSQQISEKKKNIEISNFMRTHPVRAELFHADRQVNRRTDGHDILIVGFLNFAKAPKITKRM
jgi:hypothetical protein